MFYSDYDIANPHTLPQWMLNVPSVKKIWEVPLSQLYTRKTLSRNEHGPLGRFIGGFALSLAACLWMATGPYSDYVDEGSLFVILIVPVALAAFYTFIQLLIFCFFANIIRIRRLIDTRTLQSVLAMPVNDTLLFHSILFPSVLEGLKIVSGYYMLILGLFLPFLIIQSTIGGGMEIIHNLSFFSSTGTVVFIMVTFAAPLLGCLLMSLASGLYAIKFSASLAIWFTTVHIFLTLLLTAFAGMAYFPFSENPDSNVNMHTFIVTAILVIVQVGLIILTARIGVLAFARYRRPGFYEPEWASSAGLQ